jgi:hypothetical protein
MKAERGNDVAVVKTAALSDGSKGQGFCTLCRFESQKKEV